MMDIEKRAAAIAQSEMFQGVPDTLVRRLAEIAEVQKIEAGTILAEQGSASNKICLIVEGKVAVSAVINGLESVVNMLDHGSWFGIFALTDKQHAGGRMRAAFPCRVLWLDAAEVKRALEQDPRVGVMVMTRVATEIGDRYRALIQSIQRNLREEWKGLEVQLLQQEALQKQAKP
ncbi:MAG: Crp/Fnr family transcriptional regulator [Dehalococcoidia bacterium]|nr:Crp/Fnr family transcriptional regulator [Dehalococcoidia bacterium]